MAPSESPKAADGRPRRKIAAPKESSPATEGRPIRKKLPLKEKPTEPLTNDRLKKKALQSKGDTSIRPPPKSAAKTNEKYPKRGKTNEQDSNVGTKKKLPKKDKSDSEADETGEEDEDEDEDEDDDEDDDEDENDLRSRVIPQKIRNLPRFRNRRRRRMWHERTSFQKRKWHLMTVNQAPKNTKKTMIQSVQRTLRVYVNLPM
jgi:hypothetical protein